jgi:hypothetical protein
MTKVHREVRRRAGVPPRIMELREQIAGLDYVCSGTLTRRTTRCGQPSCRCHRDPAARHGPYNDWTRLEGRKLAHRMLSDEQAKVVRAAIANFRRIRVLLRRWEDETLRAAGVRPVKNR